MELEAKMENFPQTTSTGLCKIDRKQIKPNKKDDIYERENLL